MERPANPPLRAELVESRRARPRAAGALVVAALPLLARLAVWWLSRPRAGSAPSSSYPAEVERTEMWMTKRPLGRWKLRVVRTRWSAPPPAPRGPRAAAPLWLRVLARSRGRPGRSPATEVLGLPAPGGGGERRDPGARRLGDGG